MNTPYDQDPAVASAQDDQSVGGLLRQLMHEVPQLITKELALLKAETRENIEAAKAGVAAVSTGGAVMLAGLVILLLAAVYGLSNVVEPWLAALIVGIVAMLVGFIMVKAGSRKFDAHSMRPDHTLSSLQKDKAAISRRTP